MPVFHEAATLGKTFTADSGFQAGIFNRTFESEKFLDSSMAFAREILPKDGYKRENLEMMKEGIFGQVAAGLRESFKGSSNLISRL